MTDQGETWRPTKEEWDTFVQAELDKLGITWRELERQAQVGDFQSVDAMSLWAIIS